MRCAATIPAAALHPHRPFAPRELLLLLLLLLPLLVVMVLLLPGMSRSPTCSQPARTTCSRRSSRGRASRSSMAATTWRLYRLVGGNSEARQPCGASQQPVTRQWRCQRLVVCSAALAPALQFTIAARLEGLGQNSVCGTTSPHDAHHVVPGCTHRTSPFPPSGAAAIPPRVWGPTHDAACTVCGAIVVAGWTRCVASLFPAPTVACARARSQNAPQRALVGTSDARK